MKKEQIFEEKIDDNHKATKFTVPQTQEGTIIEYSYTLQSDYYWTINRWYAQYSIPTVYAYCKMSIPDWFRVNVSMRGSEKIENNRERGSFRIISGSQTGDEGTTDFTFVAHNLPSLKSDEYVYNVNDYRSQINMEIAGISIPGQVYRDYSSTWPKIDATLQEDPDFGGRIKKSSPWKKEIEEAGLHTIENKEERIAKVFDMLKKRLKWNGSYAMSGLAASNVIKKGEGDNADLNFILISMLRDAGLNARPVVLSQRGRRSVSLASPSLNDFNTFVVAVEVEDGKYVYIDSSCRDGLINVLPTNLKAYNARFIPEKGEGKWVDLRYIARNTELVDIKAKISEDGEIMADVTTQASGNAAADMRKNFREAKDSVDYINKLANRWNGTIEEASFTDFNTLENIAKRQVKLTKQVETGADIIYLNPMIIPQLSELPFKDETRKLPVEFPYAQEIRQNVSIEIPEGYELAETPAPINARTPDGKIIFKMVVTCDGKKINTIYSFSIKETLFLENDYAGLKTIFGTMVSKNNENIVLKKKA